MEQIAPYLLALVATITAIGGLRKAMSDAETVAAQNWKILVDSLTKRITEMEEREEKREAESLENRERIKTLEKNEIEALRKAGELINQMEQQRAHTERQDELIAQLRTDNQTLEKKAGLLAVGIKTLIDQIKQQGLIPAWEPEA